MPLVLGHYNSGANSAFVVAPPPPGEAAGGGVSSRLSLGFLRQNFADPSDLFLNDCRGGLLAFVLPDSRVVVCDPWIRRYMVLAPLSMPGQCLFCVGAFLLDADETGTALHMSNFRVMRLDVIIEDITMVAMVSVFSAADNCWLLLARTMVDGDVGFAAISTSGPYIRKVCVGRVQGSLFLSLLDFFVIQVNESTGVLTTFYMPEPEEINWNKRDKPSYHRQKLRVVGQDTRTLLRLDRIVDEDLQVIQLVHGGMCVEEKRVDLSQLCNFEGAPGRLL
ncbi:hypothetical protein EJB05_50636, partial [Eragrostis curvula]